MTTEQQKIALLEWAGWKRNQIVANGPTCWHDPEGKPKAWLDQDYLLPNLDSLDVLAEFEEKLKDDEVLWDSLIQQLNYVVIGHYWPPTTRREQFRVYTAKAPHRLEALVRVLGLWREEG
jgi:hypothetical protein